MNYVDVPPQAAVEAMQNMGMPQWNVDALANLSELIRKGHSSEVSDDVAALLGKPARDFDDFAREHAAAWKA
ncbi:MAG: hypothetical protein HYS18_11795 [Burkholderiales bacterium]|nr:hypothetical protein [Burkholderiales bacterium]